MTTAIVNPLTPPETPAILTTTDAPATPTLDFFDRAKPLIDLGFTVIPLKANDKSAITPKGVEDGSKSIEALQGWYANYGSDCNVGICADENIVILESDNFEKFQALLAKVGFKLPDTLMSCGSSPNRPHLFFKRIPALDNVPNLKLDGVFELRHKNQYVVGPGSIHPDGSVYQWLNKVAMVGFPEELLPALLQIIKTDKAEQQLKYGQDLSLMGVGSHRHDLLISEAGKYWYSKKGLCSAEEIMERLKSIAAQFKEPYTNEKKMLDMVKYVMSSKPSWPMAEVVEVPKIKLPPTEVERLNIPFDPKDVIDCLAATVTTGTKLPFSFARETFKMMLLASLPDTRPVFNWFSKLHTRQYLIRIGGASTGKSEAFERTRDVMRGYAMPLEFTPGTNFGSPEYACIALGGVKVKEGNPSGASELGVEPWGNGPKPHTGQVVYYDEGVTLFQKDVGQGAARGLLTMFTSLFESNEHSTGSFKNGGAVLNDGNVSLTMNFVRSGFDKSFMGSGATRSGFLSRCTLVSDHANPVKGDWPEIDKEKVKELMGSVKEMMARTVIIEEDDAKLARLEYLDKIRSAQPTPEEDVLMARLDFLFIQDLYARAMFSDGRITTDKVEKSVMWAEHQLKSRKVLWPEDSSSDKGERMYNNLKRAYQKHGKLTHNKAKQLCNVGREGTGGVDTYNRTHKAMIAVGDIKPAGVTKKNNAVFEWVGCDE